MTRWTALRDLEPVTFKYIDDDERRAGFIAEEAPDLVATSDRTSLSPMDIVAVLTRVLKFQQRANPGAVGALVQGRRALPSEPARLKDESGATPPAAPIAMTREHGMSAELVKRSQYFNPPSTECPHSSRNHFEDWEEFHLPMARMHHVALHGRGVATGLAVSVQEGGTQIEVGPGVAVDGRGELIALSDEGQADIGIDGPGEADQQIDPPFRLGTAGRENGTHYLCIQFAQALRFTEGSCGKLEQTPWLRLLPTAGDLGPIEAGDALVLAIVEVDAEALRRCRIGPRGSRTAASCWGRARASCGSDGRRRSPRRSPMRPSGRIGARDAGGLRLSVADAADAMILDREDGGRFSRLEVHADDVRSVEPGGAGQPRPGELAPAGGRLGGRPDPRPSGAGGQGIPKVRNASGTREVMLGVDEGGGIISTMPEHDLRLRAGDNTAVMTLKADGRVGIGTAAPGEQLEVTGRIKAGHLTWATGRRTRITSSILAPTRSIRTTYGTMPWPRAGRQNFPQLAHGDHSQDRRPADLADRRRGTFSAAGPKSPRHHPIHLRRRCALFRRPGVAQRVQHLVQEGRQGPAVGRRARGAGSVAAGHVQVHRQ